MSNDLDQLALSKRAWGLEKPALGISLGGTHSLAQADQHREWVKIAEDLGIHSVWLPEMHFTPGACAAPLVELAGYAAITSRLRFGTTSLLLPLHPAEELAAEIAALDQLSGGRFLIGLGRGFNSRMLNAFGVPATEKRNRFDAALDQIFALWREGNAEHSALATHQQPHPPLAVAAFGPKGLAQAARHGLPYLASPVETLDQIADNQEHHRAQLPDPNERPLSLLMRTVFVSEDPSVLQEVRDALEAELRGRKAGMPAAVRLALESPLAERAIIGTPTEVLDGLTKIRTRLEFDLLIVRPQVAKLDPSILEESLFRLAEEIFPAVIQ